MRMTPVRRSKWLGRQNELVTPILSRYLRHRDVLAAFYDRGSGDIDARVGLVTPYQLWRFENGLDPREAARNAIFVMAITVRGPPHR
jgi:hypothetical protein